MIRVLEACAENSREYVRKFGKVPDSIFQDNPPTTLERLALSMIREAIAQGKEEKASPGGRGFPP
jgi:hypothetical protein